MSALNALRCLGVNDEICKEIADEGGMAPCMQIFSSPSDAALVKTTCQTLRQLSCSDAVKADIMKRNGAHLLAEYIIPCTLPHSFDVHFVCYSLLSLYNSYPAILEVVLGLMTLITLRQPQFAKAFCDVQCHEIIHQILVSFPDHPKVPAPSHRLLMSLSRSYVNAAHVYGTSSSEMRASNSSSCI